MVDGALKLADVAWLADALDHDDAAVRIAALHALVRLPLDRESRLALADRVEHILRNLDDPAWADHAPLVLESAAYVASPAVRDRMAEVARSDRPAAADAALAALARIGDAAAVPGLADALATGDDHGRARAAEALARIDSRDAREALQAAAGDPDVQVRFWAALGLARRGELEPMRRVLDDVAHGAEFPPLWGDPHVFLQRLAMVRSWPAQDRAALASLAAAPRERREADVLAGLLGDATSEATPGSPGFDPNRVQGAAAALDEVVATLRERAPPPDPGGEGREPRTRDVVELFDLARPLDDPWAAIELGNRIVTLVSEIGPAFDADVDAAARVYTEWDGTEAVLPQIAWVLARGGARSALDALGRRAALEAAPALLRQAARAAGDVALGLHAVSPPILGGGGVDDVPPDPADLADAPRLGRSMRGPSRGAPPAEAAEPDEPAEPVHLGASAPRRAAAGDEFTARFVAYVEALEPEVRRLLSELAPGDVPVLDVHTAQWRTGAEVTVRLTARRLEVDPPERTFTWDGRRAIEDFSVFVPDDVRTGVATTLRFEVSLLDVRVATISLPLEIADEASAERATVDALPAGAAFASYSSEDRDRVHDCMNALTSVTSMDVFMDVVNLRAGDDWHERVRAEVERRPLFLLFWSKAARESKWVDWEWREAYRQRGADSIQPVPLDPAALAEPPEELGGDQFNSVHVLLRIADRAVRAERERSGG